jgi:hypothetical protein
MPAKRGDGRKIVKVRMEARASTGAMFALISRRLYCNNLDMSTFAFIRRNGILATLFLVLIFESIGCSGSTEWTDHQGKISADIAPGIILIDVMGIGVSESGQPQHYYQYEVEPASGLVRKVKEERFQDYNHEAIPHTFYEPTGAVESCRNDPQASSINGEYLAYCRRGEADQYFVDDKKTARSLYHGALGGKREIRGFGWAPNSRSVAFLNSSSRLGKTPMELLSALSGHPVPHDTIFLAIVDARTGTQTEYLIRKDVPSAFTRMLNWSE